MVGRDFPNGRNGLDQHNGSTCLPQAAIKASVAAGLDCAGKKKPGASLRRAVDGVPLLAAARCRYQSGDFLIHHRRHASHECLNINGTGERGSDRR